MMDLYSQATEPTYPTAADRCQRGRRVRGVAMGVSVFLAAALLVAAPARAQSEPRLSALSLSDVDFGTFSGETFEYSAEIANTVSSTTVTATPSDGATVDISPGDADTVTGGHQIALSDGSNRITVTVESADGTATKSYRIRVDRESTAAFGWTVLKDVKTPLLSDERGARGLWSDADTLWTRSIDDGVIAYDFDTGARSSAHDIATKNHGNDFPEGMWSDGTTMWVSDFHKSKLFAYVLATGARQSSRDIETRKAQNADPRGLWSDGTTLWVVDNYDEKIYAYVLATGVRDSGKDLDSLSGAGNTKPAGLWSDGTTVWVSDLADKKLYAYTLETGVRDSSRDFNTLSAVGITEPSGLWSDGTTMWVADYWDDDRFYSFNIPIGGM